VATTIQLLRSDIAQVRPEPNVLANGTPMVNLHESEPGLFFAARDGSLFKVGPASVGAFAPNFFPQGQVGNCLGELWVDTSGTDPALKFFDGSDFVPAFTPANVVTSVGLLFSDIFTVTGSPVTTAGTLTATLSQQVANTVFTGPPSGTGATPTFRLLVAADIPGISASKLVSGVLDSGRIPNLDASKIESGTFVDARIPNLDISKITSGVLPFTLGGTGNSATPANGEFLIGDSTGWTKTTLTAGSNISVVNGAGSATISVVSTPAFQNIQISDPAGDAITLNAPAVTIPYTIKLPPSDGTGGALLSTDGAGQLSFITSLFGLTAIGGAANLTVNAGGANGSVILAPTGSGTISASSARITSLATPTGGTDAATKAYVDTIAAGIQPKAQVNAASTANIDLTTGGLLTIDTVPLSAGQRVLVKNQLLPEENGIYDAGLGAWTRSSDANTFAELVNATVFVAGGSVNLSDTYLCNSSAGGTINVDPVNWVVFSSGLGTVTSVGLTMPAQFTVAGSPVTTSGTFAVTLNAQTANKVFAGPVSGGAAAPTFRVLAAADIPTALNSHTFAGITPDTDATRDLGSPSLRWANIYSADLNLSNEGGSNSVDGTWGSYTIQEGEDELYLINRRSGKRYKFLLQEV
jgi:hypothetical protein